MNRSDVELKNINLDTEININDFNIGKLLSKENILNSIDANIKCSAFVKNKELFGEINSNINYFDFKNYRYDNIVSLIDIKKNIFDYTIIINDENININLGGSFVADKKNSALKFYLAANNINLSKLKLYNKFPEHELSFILNSDLSGNDIDNISGKIDFDDIKFVNSNNEGAVINDIYITAFSDSIPKNITIKSDIIDGNVTGDYNFKFLGKSLTNIFAQALPSLIKPQYI